MERPRPPRGRPGFEFSRVPAARPKSRKVEESTDHGKSVDGRFVGNYAQPVDVDVDVIREAERRHFDSRYAWRGEIRLDTPETFRPVITPEFKRGGTPGGLVHREVWNRLCTYGLADRDVLDFGSGAGHWGVRIAQEKARVRGFDLSSKGVERSNLRAERASVDAEFSCADASELPYESESFDIVVGIRALHHVIKYPGTASELHRVMRPEATAIFAENIEGNWFLRLARRRTMHGKEAEGDVILTEPMVRLWAADFGHIRIDRYKLLLMANRLGLPHQVLVGLHGLDVALFTIVPVTRRWCGECIITLRKCV